MTESFKSDTFLRQHIQSILDFYAPNVIDPNGGFFQNFMDNGQVYDSKTRHLVSSTRFIFNYARAYIEFGDNKYLDYVKSGVAFLREHHYNPKTKGYFWIIKVDNGKAEVLDDNNHCYGLAFVILAYSWAYRAGMNEAKEYIEQSYQLLNHYFWDDKAGLYKDEYNGDFSLCSPYRGQNANMHSCEAMLAAFDATGIQHYLTRAIDLAENMALSQRCEQNLIWEHYDENWQIDWNYNKDDPKNLFRPWGFQPGHQTEWAKLLLMINQRQPDKKWQERACFLFDKALESAWDEEFGGICYGFAPDYSLCDGEKYFWVQAESFAAAARLARVTQEQKYWDWYEKIWNYAWQHFVDHQYGAWFRILSRENQKLEATKSPVGKTDYHTMGACYDVLDIMR